MLKGVEAFASWARKDGISGLRLEVGWAVQNYLVGLVDLSCCPHCGLSRKPIYAGQKGWALKLKPKANFLFKPISKSGLGFDRKPASMVGLDAGLGSLDLVTQPNFGLLINVQEGKVSVFLPSQSAQNTLPVMVLFSANIGSGLAYYSGETGGSSSGV